MEKMGDVIRRLRQERNMTQEQLAEAISISPEAIQYYEANVWQPGKPVMVRMAVLWGIPMEEFMGKEDDDGCCGK